MLWEYYPKGNPYLAEVYLGSFRIGNYEYEKKLIKFKDNSYCLALQILP